MSRGRRSIVGRQNLTIKVIDEIIESFLSNSFSATIQQIQGASTLRGRVVVKEVSVGTPISGGISPIRVLIVCENAFVMGINTMLANSQIARLRESMSFIGSSV